MKKCKYDGQYCERDWINTRGECECLFSSSYDCLNGTIKKETADRKQTAQKSKTLKQGENIWILQKNTLR